MPVIEPADAKAWPVDALPPDYTLDFDPTIVTDGSTATMAPSFREYPSIRSWWVRYDLTSAPDGPFDVTLTTRTTPEAVAAAGGGSPQLEVLVEDPVDFPDPIAAFTVTADNTSTAWLTQTLRFFVVDQSVTTLWLALHAGAVAGPGVSHTESDLAEIRLTMNGDTIPPTRLFPRDDTAGNTPRIHPPPRSIQSGNRLNSYY